MANQMPVRPKIRGSTKIAATWNTKVRRKEMRAETRPLFKAVKKLEPQILMPAKIKLKRQIRLPHKVISISWAS